MILEFSLVCLTLLLLYVSILVKSEVSQRTKLKCFPGPISFGPGFGSLIQVGFVKFKYYNCQLFEKLHQLNNIYGKTFTAKIGFINGLVTEDFEIAKEILNSPDFLARFPAHERFKEPTYFQNLGVVFGKDESWKEMRKFLTKGLKLYGFGELNASELLLEEELDHFVNFLDEDRSRNKDEVYVHQYFKVAIFNVLWRVMSGGRFEYDDPTIHKMIEALDTATQIEIGFDLEWAYPILRFIPGFAKSRRLGWALAYCHEFFRETMVEKRNSGVYKEKQENFIDYFLKKVDEEKYNVDTLYTDEQFLTTCCDIVYTGLDTTAHAVAFAVLYLVKNPEVQQKCQDEIDRVIGTERMPYCADLAKLPYMKAVRLEVLRLGNIVPLLARTSTCDTKIAGHFVENDTMAALNATIIHNDPEIWGDPENFRPERFLDDDNINIINEDKLLVFGLGKRHCIGETMGKVMMFKFLATLLQKYNFKISPAHPELSAVPLGGVANNVQPFYCLVERRSSPSSTINNMTSNHKRTAA